MRGGYYMNSKIYIEQLPIFLASEKECAPIVKRINAIIADPDAPGVPALEKEIDDLVYQLHGLTPEEIAIVEGRK